MALRKDLFQRVIAPERLHPQFRDLDGSPIHATARRLINDLYGRMGDPNGNFARDFQGHGFHGRLFEIACFAYLEAARLAIDRAYAFPDFMVRHGAHAIAIEAVTANPPDGTSADVSVARIPELTVAEIHDKASTEFPRRLLAVLMKKVRHGYHKHDHVAGKPLVLMIAPFYEPGSSFYIEDSLLPALFPMEPHPPVIPFFAREEAAVISAITYCNAFSVSKFWRMADTEYVAENFIAERSGHAFFEGKDTLHEFRYRVGHEATPAETWHEGVTLIVNPFAKAPLPDGVLPASSTISVAGDRLDRRIKGFHPLTSAMIVHPRT